MPCDPFINVIKKKRKLKDKIKKIAVEIWDLGTKYLMTIAKEQV